MNSYSNDVIMKQDRLQDILVVLGLRETMEFQRSSFSYPELYSIDNRYMKGSRKVGR